MRLGRRVEKQNAGKEARPLIAPDHSGRKRPGLVWLGGLLVIAVAVAAHYFGTCAH